MKDKLETVMRFFLFTLILILPFAKAGIDICIYLTFFLWLIARLMKTSIFTPKHILTSITPEQGILNAPIAFFLFAGFISVLGSFYFLDSLRAFLGKTLRGITLYFMVVELIKSRKHLIWILWLFLLSAMLASFAAIFYFFVTPDILGKPFNHPNSLAGYLIFPLILLLALMTSSWRAKGKGNLVRFSGMLLLLLLFSSVLLFTKSRGGWMGFICGTLFLLALLNKKRLVVILISGIAIVGMLFFLAPKIMIENLRLSQAKITSVAADRVHIWAETSRMILDKPVFGHGPVTYMREFQKYRDLPWNKNPIYAHNCYLQMAAEIGLVGLAAFLWIIIRLLKEGLVYIKQNKKNFYILAGIMGGWLAFLVHGFFDSVLYSLQLSVLFWFMTGLAAATIEKVSE